MADLQAPEKRGYLLNEYTGAREYFVLRGGVLRIRQSPHGADTGSVYLAYGSEVRLLSNKVLEVRSKVPYVQEYMLTASSEDVAEGWHDAMQASMKTERARMQRFIDLLENGCTMHKYNYSNSKRSRRYFWVADAGRELCWGRSKGDDVQKVNLRECIGIIYGPMTTTFQRCVCVEDPSWTCFSLLFMGRTLDLAVAGDLQVHAWFLGMQHLISRHGIGSMPMMSYTQFVARRVQYKLMDEAHREGLVLGRYLLSKVRKLAASKGLAGLGKGALVSGGRLAAPMQALGSSATPSDDRLARKKDKTSKSDEQSPRTPVATERMIAMRARYLELQAQLRERSIQSLVAADALKRLVDIPASVSEAERQRVAKEVLCTSGLAALRQRCALLEQDTQRLNDEGETLSPKVKASEKVERSIRKIQQKVDETEAKRVALEAEVKTLKDRAEASSGAGASSSSAERAAKEKADELQRHVNDLEKRLKAAAGQRDAEAEAKCQAMDKAIAEAEQAKVVASQKLQATQRERDKLKEEEAKSRASLEKAQSANRRLDSAIAPLKEAIARLKEERLSVRKDLVNAGSSFASDIQKVYDAAQKFNERSKETEVRYKDLMEQRKALHNLVLDLKGNIRVFVRVRPINAREQAIEPQGEPTVTFQDGSKLGIYDAQHARRKWFDFDNVFPPDSQQTAVFEEAKPLATSVLDGYNVCVFAYGQTGSGKTHTMTGTKADPGLNTRVLTELFRIRDERKGTYEMQIILSITEIYNETIRDLLAPSGKKLDVKLNTNGTVEVPGVEEVKVESVADVLSCINSAHKNRSTSTTDMNDQSSRSHSIVTVKTVSALMGGDTYIGKIHLIDLAGSENVSKSGVSGQGMKEAQNINKSLSALGDVIQSLVAKNPHTPYRNSKLTMMLKDSLGGDSKTLMIVCASPAQTNCTETLSSLNFASRARNVELGKAKRNVAAT